MKKTIQYSLKTGLAIAGVCAASWGTQAQTSVLYITQDGLNGVTVGYQNGAELLRFPWAGTFEKGIYVDAAEQAIRQQSWHHSRGPAHAYSLSGALTATYGDPEISNQIDAAFDGHNVYLIDTNNLVHRANKDFSNQQLLFEAPGDQGITYDTRNGTLWTCNREGAGTITEWDLNGTVITQITVLPGAELLAMAYDPADDTLWLTDANTNQMFNFSKTGTLLGTITVNLPAIAGAEFAILPPTECETLLAQAELGLDTALDEILTLDAQIAQLNSDLQSAQQDLADCQSDLAQAELDLNTALDEILNLNGQINQLNAQINQLNSDLQSAQQDLANCQSNLAQAQQDLATANATIADQAQEIDSLTQQNSALQGQLNVFDSSLQLLTSTLATNFQDPGFTIPGATTAEQLEALVNAIIDLNRGRQKGLYENLTGNGNESDDESMSNDDDEESNSKSENEESKSKGKKSGKKKD